ncbi:MAG: hypothetical protein EBS91_06035 [Betaproteobacteria bacterium]|nr:hypothetical protein [Betaproteobacteria bacterium]
MAKKQFIYIIHQVANLIGEIIQHMLENKFGIGIMMLMVIAVENVWKIIQILSNYHQMFHLLN